jgi:hypothetical protein
MLQEANYTNTPWNSLIVISGLLFGFGGVLLYTNPQVATDMTMRAYAVLTSGLIIVGGVGIGKLFVPKQLQTA